MRRVPPPITNKIYLGDCLDLMKAWPDGFINTCITSPPYWGLRDYGTPPRIWRAAEGCDHDWGAEMKRHKGGPHGDGVLLAGGRAVIEAQAATKDIKAGAFCQKCDAWRGNLGLEPTPELFIENMVEVYREVKRVLRNDGTLWLNIGDTYSAQRWSAGTGQPMNGNKDVHRSIVAERQSGLPPKNLVGIPWRLALALQADGWYLRSDIIWHKPNPMPESVTDRPTKSHEYLFLLAKSEDYFYDSEAIRESATITDRPNQKRGEFNGKTEAMPGRNAFRSISESRNKRTVWTIATAPFKEAHFATFPEKLIEPCILAGTSDFGYCDCGAPWTRMVEASGGAIGEGFHDHKDDLKTGQRVGTNGKGGRGYKRETKGWVPSCKCKTAYPDGPGRRGLVFDPFMGAGTTALVSSRLNRDFIGCELKSEYLNMAERRIADEVAQGKFL